MRGWRAILERLYNVTTSHLLAVTMTLRTQRSSLHIEPTNNLRSNYTRTVEVGLLILDAKRRRLPLQKQHASANSLCAQYAVPPCCS